MSNLIKAISDINQGMCTFNDSQATLAVDPGSALLLVNRSAPAFDLHAAIRNTEFVLKYQAQVTMDQSGNQRVSGAEALVRWLHPQLGLVSPLKFIALAEESGLMEAIGLQILEVACRQLASWATRVDLQHLELTVNVSACQFDCPQFVGQVRQILERTGAKPHRLKLELTESVPLSNVEDAVMKMVALRSLGIKFSLDDFGTGHSSLSCIKRLPLDQLKIDQSFVRDILSDRSDVAITGMVIALAQHLNLNIVAEGVEKAAQVDCLARLGCRAYQGYYFSRPVPINQFENFALSFNADTANTTNDSVLSLLVA